MAALTNPITADGDYDIDCPSDKVSINITGTFGSGTVTLKEYNESAGTYTEVPTGSWTAESTFVYQGSASNKLRFNLSGSSSPSLHIVVRKMNNG